MFGGVPEGAAYRLPYARHHYTRNGLDRTARPYTRSTPRPPSPSLTAQRLIREQQVNHKNPNCGEFSIGVLFISVFCRMMNI